MARTPCPGSNIVGIDYGVLPSGWPHGRHECPSCGGFYSLNANSRLRKHVPHAGDNGYIAENRAALYAQNEASPC